MKQNIYDNPKFYEGYRALRDGDTGLNGTVEIPNFLTILPPLLGRRVLDLGSGFGEFCRYARQEGAVQIQGVEISSRMIKTAKARTSDPEIEYINSAMENFAIAPNSYDVIVSKLAIHYVRDYQALVHSVFGGLREGGHFVFSIEHPVCTALCEGWYHDDDGEQLFWPVDDYHQEGERRLRWFVEGVLKYHRTVQTYVNTLLDAGFVLARLLEPVASPEHIEKRPELKNTLRRPSFLMLAARKPGGA